MSSFCKKFGFSHEMVDADIGFRQNMAIPDIGICLIMVDADIGFRH